MILLIQQQTNQHKNSNERLTQWETELDEKGFITDENELLTAIRHQTNPDYVIENVNSGCTFTSKS